MAEAPPDPTVTRRTFQCGGGKAEYGDPSITKSGDIPDGFADFGQGLEVVVRMHQLLKALLFC